MASRLAARRNQAQNPLPRPVSLKRRRELQKRTSENTPETRVFDRSLFAQISGRFSTHLKSIGILGFYVILRFGLSQQIDALGSYASYAIESAFVIAVGFIYRDRIRLGTSIFSETTKSFVPALILGFTIGFGLNPLGLSAPFDFSAAGSISLLVLFGPILEELIFRMALWHPLLDLSQIGESKQHKLIPALGTSALFSYAHFHVYWILPPGEIRSFVIYQTIYVLSLAAVCAYRLIQTNSILSPMAVHIGFNLGFFIALKTLV